MTQVLPDYERRVLLLCPTGRDSDLAAATLRTHSLAAHVCASLPELIRGIHEGAACLLIAEEALDQEGMLELRAHLRDQPTWSDMPLLLLARHGAESWATMRAVELLGNVTILERPARIAALVSAVRAALRARERQYDLREQLREREAAAEALAERDESLRMALAAGNMGAFDLDVASSMATWTEASFTILGHAPTPDRRASFSMWLTGIPEEHRGEVLRQHELARTSKSRFALEHAFVRPNDGKKIWLTTVGRFIYDENDAPFRLLGVFFDSTRRRELEEGLRASNTDLVAVVDERTRELRNLSHHLIEISENEKRALARELHDELGAMMTALLIDLDLIRRKAESPALKEVANRAAELVQSAAIVKRRIMEGLRPSVLDMMGLHEALKSLATDFSRRTSVECHIDRIERIGEIDQRIAIALYRIAQEALTNVAKYAQASRVDIGLTQVDRTLRLSVHDDGTGFAETAQGERRTHGISGMRERVTYLGGEFLIEAGSNGRGTAVHVRIPLTDDAAPAHDSAAIGAASKSAA